MEQQRVHQDDVAAVFSESEAGRVDFLDALREPGHAGS
jgi:hypothetical protein